MRKCTSVQDLFPRIRPANGVQKEQLDFHLAPAVLLTDPTNRPTVGRWETPTRQLGARAQR
jgi:hypothetical protein